MQQVYHMLSSSICVSVSSRLMSFIKKTIFKLAEQNRSVLPRSSTEVCSAFIICLWFTDAKYTCRRKEGGRWFSPCRRYVLKYSSPREQFCRCWCACEWLCSDKGTGILWDEVTALKSQPLAWESERMAQGIGRGGLSWWLNTELVLVLPLLQMPCVSPGHLVWP